MTSRNRPSNRASSPRKESTEVKPEAQVPPKERVPQKLRVPPKAHVPKTGQQLRLLPAPTRHFGGRLLLGKRKGCRPLAFRRSMHLVMRSLWAKGEYSFRHPRNLRSIENILKSTAQRYGMKVYVKAIMSNHLHLVIRTQNRDLYNAFVRVISGLIASHVMRRLSFQEFLSSLSDLQLLTSEPQGKGQKFWVFRPFTRILQWGRDYATCCEYVRQNTLEAVGFIIYRPRKDRYATWMKESLVGSVLVT